jgi:O-Antigen ligase
MAVVRQETQSAFMPQVWAQPRLTRRVRVLPDMSRRTRSWAVGVSVSALVTAANGSQGGYFSQSWGWIALAFVAATSLTLILDVACRPRWLRGAFAALMAALGVWVALSATWSITPAGSLREVERVLVYVALAAALALVLRRGDATALATGVFAGSALVAGYALAARLFPDKLESYDDPTLPYRLAEPVGYWNSLGLLAAMGLLVGVGIAAHGRNRPAVALAGGCLPLLAATLYFTFSRGAWAALAVGLLALVALDPRRLRLSWCALVVGPVAAVCVAAASQHGALTTEGAARADVADEGRRLAIVVAVLMIASGALAVVARLVAVRMPAPRWAARTVDVAFATLAIAAVATGLFLAGGPAAALAEIRDRFEGPVAGETGVDLNDRLFSVSGNGRAESVGIALDAGRERPLLGYGAGSYESIWYERRETPYAIRDAHGLYAEVFGELGVVGLVLLGLALLVPLAAAVQARRSRLVPAATAAYIAWAAHAALDWHWEVVGVTTAALLAGGVALLAAERGHVRALPTGVRWPLLAASIGLTLLALVSLVGNQALFAGQEAVERKQWSKAVGHARRAEALLPWSFEPHVVLGDAAAGRGDRARALAEYRRAVEIDPHNWVAWLRLGQVARGTERRAAYVRVRELNPREGALPGEPDDVSPRT